MLDGSPPEEPDEDDPSEEWREHERVDGPYQEPSEPDIGPDVPEVPDPSTNDVSSELHHRFWALVVVFNVALLALSLGAMFAVFDGNYSLGGQLFVGGLVAFVFGLYRYRTTKERLGEITGSNSTGEESADEPVDGANEQNG